MWPLHGGGTGLKHLKGPGCDLSQKAECMGLIDLGVVNLLGQKGVKRLRVLSVCRMGLRDLAAKRVLGMGRMGLMDMSHQKSPGCGLSLRAEWTLTPKHLTH